MPTQNFATSLKRSRKEFGHARANNLAIEASEAKSDILREIARDIRNVKNKLTAIEDETYDDPLIIALKKGTSIDIRNDVVQPRHELLLQLRNLVIKRKLFEKDSYFNLPDDFGEESDKPDNVDDLANTEGDIDDVIATSES